MTFSDQLTALQSLYRLQHDLGNKISGASFAEERGHLSPEDKIELVQMTDEYQLREKEAEFLREKIKTEFPKEYAEHLASLHAKLTAIQKHLAAMTGEQEFKNSFNKTICESLLSDLSKLIKNRDVKYNLNWLFDVSDRIILEYKTSLKL